MNFATEANRYANNLTYSTNLGRSSRASDWYDTAWRDETVFWVAFSDGNCS